MPTVRAAIDTDALLELVWAAPVAVTIVTIAWAMVIHGATRFADARGEGRRAVAAGHLAVCAIGAVIFTAAVVFGIVIMRSK